MPSIRNHWVIAFLLCLVVPVGAGVFALFLGFAEEKVGVYVTLSEILLLCILAERYLRTLKPKSKSAQ